MHDIIKFPGTYLYIPSKITGITETIYKNESSIGGL